MSNADRRLNWSSTGLRGGRPRVHTCHPSVCSAAATPRNFRRKSRACAAACNIRWRLRRRRVLRRSMTPCRAGASVACQTWPASSRCSPARCRPSNSVRSARQHAHRAQQQQQQQQQQRQWFTCAADTMSSVVRTTRCPPPAPSSSGSVPVGPPRSIVPRACPGGPTATRT